MLKFKRNMNSVDRSIRLITGTLLLIVGPLSNLIDTDTMSNIILGTLGTTAVLSGLFAYCILYEVTGFNSRQ